MNLSPWIVYLWGIADNTRAPELELCPVCHGTNEGTDGPPCPKCDNAGDVPRRANTETRTDKHGDKERVDLEIVREALRPFEEMANKFDVEPYSANYPDGLLLKDRATVAEHNYLTLGDCRKAKTAAKMLDSTPPSSTDGKTEGKVEWAIQYYDGVWHECPVNESCIKQAREHFAGCLGVTETRIVRRDIKEQIIL